MKSNNDSPSVTGSVTGSGIGRLSGLVVGSLVLSGCMMSGMMMGPAGGADTHAGSPVAPMTGPTVVKETVVNAIRLTVTFPAYSLGEDLTYPVEVRDGRGVLLTSDATLYLIATPQSSPQMPHAAQHDVGELRVTPVRTDGGALAFQPTIATEGTYRMRVVAERVGPTALDPPMQVEHTVRLEKPMTDRAANRSWVAGAIPTVLVGAVAMAVMMLFVFR